MEASAVFCCLQLYKNNDVRIPYNLGLIYSLQGKHQLALAAYDLALKIQPDDAEVLINKGSTYNDIKNYVLALEALEKATQIRPDIPEAWSNKGIALNNLNLYQESINAYNEAIRLTPSYHEAWSNKSAPLNKLKRFLEASEACDKALSLNPDYAEGWSNKGVTLHELKRYDEAITNYDKALSLKPDYAEGWFNKGAGLYELKRYDEAIAHYDRALSLKPDYHEAWSNKGNALNELKRFDEAITNYDKALSLKPDYAEGWSNKGVTLHELKRFDEAIAHYDKALSLKPDYAEGWSNKGITLNELKRYDEAIAHYDKALSLKPDIDWTSGDLLHTKMKICSWSGLIESLENISKKVVANEKVAAPFPLLALNDDALLHKKSSEIYIQSKYLFNPILGPILKRPQSQKIRVGYFSADFKNHPVSLLTAELYELHDKNQFEIIAFSFGVDDKSPMRLRLSQAFDQYIDVSDMSDLEIAELSRNLKIDIAVDLGGFTSNSRTGIFSYRAAPIQLSYIGYLGTMGTEYYDYLLADKTIISIELQKFYSEKIAYLPSYQVNDRKRIISDRQFTRVELGLPENGFIFCCFNNNYKILPAMFDSWMRILNAVEGSVLFLYAENEWSKANLIQEASLRGIDSARLIFGAHIPTEEYLARYRVCDLFLDTFPYNAGTTASDALWVGLPVLTLMGQSFASRMAASLLNAIGLPELITNTQAEYETLAIELAMNHQKLRDIKLKLANNRLTAPLFDTPLFVKNIEAAYLTMVEQYQADLESEHIFVV
jgi:predicted O-linked N-acetylglucosamine transferase (SPINDLY family)